MLKHGECTRGFVTTEYASWNCMVSRCHSPSTNGYKHYGGRGIFVCDEWRYSYKAFLGDMGRKPSPEHTIERIDNNLGYFKENCKWATRREQHNNKSSTRILEFDGVSKPIGYWAEEYAIDPETIRSRIRFGWSVKAAITTSVRKKPIKSTKALQISYGGLTLNLHQWSARTGIKAPTICKRINVLKWTIEEALSTPVR
jgi:hypothetical protein